jgi:predicted chitinase
MASNRDIVINELKASGITNEYSIAAILAIIDKESGFVPQSEISYARTSNARIRSIFDRTNNLSDAQLNALKKDPVAFFNYVYGGRFGNSATEGYTYRGRGFNQLTFKGNYKRYADLLKLPLIENPDLVNDTKVAAKIVAAYMNTEFKKNASIVLKRYGAKNINDFKDKKTAVNAFYNANAGFGKDTSKITTAGKTKALKKVNSFFNITPATGLAISLPLIILGGLAFYYFNK